MRMRIRVPLRHPVYPDWVATPAREGVEECAVISGTFPELARAATAGAKAKHAVFALQGPDNPFLGDRQRDILWEAFQVPIFALLLDREGRLAGWECEAQDGLHVGGAWVEEEIWVYRLLTSVGELESAPCECGRPGERVRKVQKREPVKAPASADRADPVAEAPVRGSGRAQ